MEGLALLGRAGGLKEGEPQGSGSATAFSTTALHKVLGDE